ncbi:MAG: Holliday junction resolvase RuvX, partial [Acidobacteriaceae bacterium]|nr:Holliday junction resolvase RuvX [Acidobacteriaceae bacterium]
MLRLYNCAVSSEDNARGTAPHGRILALDVGARRIGVAVTDSLGITAQGLETIQRRNKRADMAELERLVREYGVTEIVVGYPLRMSGSTGT